MRNILYIATLFLPIFLLLSITLNAGVSSADEPALSLETLLLNNHENLHEIEEQVVINFYKSRKYKPLWSNKDGMLNRAFDLLIKIAQSEDDGLNPSDYYLDKIMDYWALRNTDALLQLDLLLTAALYRYSNHVYAGKFNPDKIDVDWHIKNKSLNMSNLLKAVAKHDSISKLLNDLPPQHQGYQQLKLQLQKFREIESHGGWLKIDDGPILKVGIQHNQVVQLRQRLKITNNQAVNSPLGMDIFDSRLAESVKIFQKRHGLTIDGKVGSKTRKMLNISVSKRIKQIRINMERWRWMPRKLGNRYLLVNMTGFELYLIEDGAPILSMPVIVGKSFRSTPSFSGLLSFMEYNPYWTVPRKLALHDLIPLQIRDSYYFEKKSIKVFRGWGENIQEIDPLTVDWRRIDKDHFPYWLRQEPGNKNSLGRVKFLFSNPYDIYLHGTPDIHLFDRVVRTFSSGCIRVKNPIRLAAYLLNDSSQKMEEEILSNILLDTNQSVMLPVAVPIYLVYWTAWVDQENGLNFRDDIYGRDAILNDLFMN